MNLQPSGAHQPVSARSRCATRKSPHAVHSCSTGSQISQQRQRVLVHMTSPVNPQGVHMPVPTNSTGRPHPMHITREGGFDQSAPRRGWAQNGLSLGTTVGTTRENCGRAGRGKNSSTGRPNCPRADHPGCPHARTASELRRWHLSTQPTTLTTITAFKSLEEKKKTKTTRRPRWGHFASKHLFVAKSMVRPT
jgi:hypothetical protein